MTKPRAAPQKPIIIIPARMASTRLPGKPLADICGQPMIAHVWQKAAKSGIGPVLVACDTAEIAEAVEKAGGKAVLTDPNHPSGSDRIWQALNMLEDSKDYDAIINLQGDLPLIDPRAITAAYDLLKNPDVDIATLAVAIKDEKEKTSTQVVKAVFDLREESDRQPRHGRALYFSRNSAPHGEGGLYHHVGLYAYRRDALERFVKTPPSSLELREKLEQLRALSLGMHIEVGVIDTVPMGVDTQEDLEAARQLLDKEWKKK